MPTIDRRGRARKKTDEPVLRGESLFIAMRLAAGNPEAWAALRPRAIRGLMNSRTSADDAARAFEAYGRKPHYIPRPPPAGMANDPLEGAPHE
ncbi:MAG: hypothetical protein EOO27_01700 [Comamonadaceae bacterium]|nr:MAG: hypothetical protein EOO27_01700 [Comamonadaceae bacterium]